MNIAIVEDGMISNVVVIDDSADPADYGGIPLPDGKWIGDSLVELSDVKAAKISASKTALADYLASHPLTWTDGQVYSVTEEKQGLLTSQLALAQVAAAASQPYTLRWNASGGVCTEWTFSNLSALALAIGAYVQPLVSQQQAYEVAVNACETVSAVEEVPLDYGAAEGGNDA